MVKPVKFPMYMPMNKSNEWIKAQKTYLNQIDKQYGTQFAIRDYKKAGDKK